MFHRFIINLHNSALLLHYMNGKINTVNVSNMCEYNTSCIATGRVSARSSLLFEHEINTEEMLATAQEAQQTMVKLCQKSQDGITPDVPGLFNLLIHQIRRLDTRTLNDFYRSVGSTCNKAP